MHGTMDVYVCMEHKYDLYIQYQVLASGLEVKVAEAAHISVLAPRAIPAWLCLSAC